MFILTNDRDCDTCVISASFATDGYTVKDHVDKTFVCMSILLSEAGLIHDYFAFFFLNVKLLMPASVDCLGLGVSSQSSVFGSVTKTTILRLNVCAPS